MERIIESVFGLKFWRNRPNKQKEIERKNVQRNLIRFSNCISDRHYDPDFAGARDFAANHVVTGR